MRSIMIYSMAYKVEERSRSEKLLYNPVDRSYSQRVLWTWSGLLRGSLWMSCSRWGRSGSINRSM